MEDEKRRKLDELVVRYQLEPSLNDVYVEGLTDKRIIQWFLDKSNLDTKNVAVYEIDTIDIPTDRLFALELNNGNRSRVIFLAFELQSLFEGSLPPVICIADKDGSSVLTAAHFSGKCQRSNARISKFIKFLKPKPLLFNSFNLVLIPSTIPLVLIQNTPQFLRTIF